MKLMSKMFKESFKHFKSRKVPPDMSTVVDFNSNCHNEKVRTVHTDTKIEETEKYFKSFGLKPANEWNIFEIKDKPGLIFIRNPFTSLGQRYWIARCLRDFSQKPNKLNLDIHNDLAEYEDWWELCNADKTRGPYLLEKLRWATMGYHHNWDTKIYTEDYKDKFPVDLSMMCKFVGHILGTSNFSAEAAIVNYYRMDSSLSGHTDHSEQDLDAPLFSFSFGQSAVFLIGGQTLDEKPTAMFIHSGDIVVMSRESRQSYHAVPCIVKAPNTTWNNFDDMSTEYFNDDETVKELIANCTIKEFWIPFDAYCSKARININVRQVLKPDHKYLL